MNSVKNLLFNPFDRIAGSKALFAGIAVMAITAVCAYLTDTHYDGLLDIHVGYRGTAAMSFIEQFLVWMVSANLFFLSGKLFSKSAIRYLDVAGTMALSRAPMILGCLVGLFFPDVNLVGMKDFDPETMTVIIALGFVSAIPVIWYVALMYNAFSVSCNLRGTRGIIVFTGTLIVSEIVSKFLFIAYATML